MHDVDNKALSWLVHSKHPNKSSSVDKLLFHFFSSTVSFQKGFVCGGAISRSGLKSVSVL